MYIHLGGNVIRSEKEILSIFDVKTFHQSPVNQEVLKTFEKEGRVKTLDKGTIRSVIFIKGKNQRAMIYYSPITPWTLLKRQVFL